MASVTNLLLSRIEILLQRYKPCAAEPAVMAAAKVQPAPLIVKQQIHFSLHY